MSWTNHSERRGTRAAGDSNPLFRHEPADLPAWPGRWSQSFEDAKNAAWVRFETVRAEQKRLEQLEGDWTPHDEVEARLFPPEPETPIEEPATEAATNPTNLPVDEWGNILDGSEDEVEGTAVVLLNEQHKLLPAQEAALDAEFGEGGWEIARIPAEGWTLEQIRSRASLFIEERWRVVFASPIPLLIGILAKESKARVWIFHNDRRESREVPDGKGGVRVIHVVSPEGWKLVEI